MNVPSTENPPTGSTSTDNSPAHTDARQVRPWDLVGLGLLALLVRAPSYFATRALTFDDGVFANSVIAMRHGGIPFKEVFSSQGPLFLPLAFVGDLITGRTLDSPRTLAVASGLAAVLFTYLVALRMSDRLGALLAGALVATSGGLAWVTGPLAADGPALAFAVAAVWCSLRMRDRPSIARAIWLGLCTGAVLSTKSLEAPVLVVVGMVLLAPVVSEARRHEFDGPGVMRGLVAAASALVLFAVVSVPFGLSEVWDQSVTYRTDAASNRDIPATVGKLLATLWDRDLALLFFAAVAIGSALYLHRRKGAPRNAAEGQLVTGDASFASRVRWNREGTNWVPSDRLLAVAWLTTTFVWLCVVVSPLWRPHVAAMSIPLALVIAVYRPPARICLTAGVLAIPLVFIQLDGLIIPGDYTGTSAQIFDALDELPNDAVVISDEPGVVWRSGTRSTDDLVDPSMLRREQDRYTAASLLRAASSPRVCAFVRYSPQRFGYFAELPSGLEKLGYEAVPEVGDGEVLYVKPSCMPLPGDS